MMVNSEIETKVNVACKGNLEDRGLGSPVHDSDQSYVMGGCSTTELISQDEGHTLRLRLSVALCNHTV